MIAFTFPLRFTVPLVLYSLVEMLPRVETRVVLVGEAGKNGALVKAMQVPCHNGLSPVVWVVIVETSLHYGLLRVIVFILFFNEYSEYTKH